MSKWAEAYKYNIPREVDHPFYGDDDTPGGGSGDYVKSVSFSHEAITGGTKYTETVTNSDDTTATQEITVPDATAGEKGEKGDKGDTGETGATGPAGADGVTPDISIIATVDDTTGTPAVTVTKSGTAAVPVFDMDFTGLKGERGETGATGPQGPQGETGATGATGPDYNAVVSSSITNENGVYTIKNTMHDGSEVEAGTIEVPAQERGIVEVKDTVVSNDTTGYDFHTVTETEDGGTENEVGKFYIAQKQITGIAKNDNELEIKTVNQSGEEATQQIELPSGSSGGGSGIVTVRGTIAEQQSFTGGASSSAEIHIFLVTANVTATTAAGEQSLVVLKTQIHIATDGLSPTIDDIQTGAIAQNNGIVLFVQLGYTDFTNSFVSGSWEVCDFSGGYASLAATVTVTGYTRV